MYKQVDEKKIDIYIQKQQVDYNIQCLYTGETVSVNCKKDTKSAKVWREGVL